jgi:hypothetical protein
MDVLMAFAVGLPIQRRRQQPIDGLMLLLTNKIIYGFCWPPALSLITFYLFYSVSVVCPTKNDKKNFGGIKNSHQ